MSNEKRSHFGVLLSSIEESCQSEVWKGIQAFAEKYDITVTAYLATFQQQTGRVEEHYEVVYDAIKANQSLDGLVVLSGFIADDIGTKALLEFMNDYQNVPKVSVAMTIKNTPSLLADNESGTYKVVSHIIKHHDKRRVAFVKGPDAHQEAEARLAGYKRALEDNGISYDKSLVFPGHFSEEDGEDAVNLLIKNGVSFDSVVAADDDTAIGVINQLEKLKISVPGDISVGGFDDAKMAEVITPSLTTVRQPFFELGFSSMEQLFKQVNGENFEMLTEISPVLVSRQSCGCVDSMEHVTNCYPSVVGSAEMLVADVYSTALNLFDGMNDNKLIERWVESLCSSVTARVFDVDMFLKSFDGCLIHYKQFGKDLSIWRDLLSVLLAGVEKLYVDDRARFNAVGQAIYQASWLINRAQERDRLFEYSEKSETDWEIRGISQDIVTSFDFDELQSKVGVAVEELDLGAVIVYLYDKEIDIKKWKTPKKMTGVIGFDGHDKVIFHRGNVDVNFSTIYEAGTFDITEKRRTLFFMPLFFGKKQIGVMLFEYQPEMPIDMYESLRISISTALKGASLIQDVKNISITDELTGLYNRRGFLTLSYSRLKHFRRSHMTSAVFFIDMDGLKHINDVYGHAHGDKAIAACAKVLRQSLRDEDIIGRMGGDEFTIFAARVDETHVNMITSRFRTAFKKLNEKSTQPYEINASIGAALITDFTEKAFSEILSQADRLLYEEKEEKRARGIGRID